MRPTDRLLLLVAAAGLAFALVYGLNPPAPRYLPLTREWVLSPPAGAPAMAWYGRCAWGFGAAALATLLAALLVRPGERAVPPRLVTWLSIVLPAAFVLLAASIVVHEFAAWGVIGLAARP